jgi:hypothetical protein
VQQSSFGEYSNTQQVPQILLSQKAYCRTPTSPLLDAILRQISPPHPPIPHFIMTNFNN